MLGVTTRSKHVKLEPSQSHLRISRQLRNAAIACMAEGNRSEAVTVIETVRKFITSVTAPHRTSAGLDAFEKEMRGTTRKDDKSQGGVISEKVALGLAPLDQADREPVGVMWR